MKVRGGKRHAHDKDDVFEGDGFYFSGKPNSCTA